MSKDNHHFNVSVAMKYGVDVAIFLDSIAYWIHLNMANNKHLHDGRYWTYNTSEAFTVIFPYWSTDQIDRIIKKCIDNDLITKGNYNTVRYDKTRWLTLTDNGLELYGMTLPRNRGIETAESRDRGREIAEPIPITNTGTNTDLKNSCSSADERKTDDSLFDRFWEAYPRKVNRKTANKIWIKNKLNEKADIIIADVINRTQQEWRHKSKQYIPHASTYLNAERWQDEITPTESQGVQRNGVKPQSSAEKHLNFCTELYGEAMERKRRLNEQPEVFAGRLANQALYEISGDMGKQMDDSIPF